MAAQLRAGESPRKGVRRIVRGQIDKGLEDLDAGGDPAQVIHSARKRLKRLRALLRLVRDGMDRATFDRERARFRDAARPLSEVRDAEVLVAAFAGLGDWEHRREDSEARAALVARREETGRRVLGEGSALDELASQLNRARRALDSRAFADVRWSTLRDGLGRIYRRGRRAFAEAVEDPTDENLHEWRKRVKDLGYALEVVAPIRRGFAGRRIELAGKLAELLGDDHDLAVLRTTLLGPTMPAASATRFLPAIDGRRAELREEAFALGRKLYGERPSAVVGRLDKSWHAWRSRVGSN